MINIETREYVRTIVNENPEGLTLSYLHGKVYRIITRLQLRTCLSAMFMRSEISRERVTMRGKRETKYYPFNGTPPQKKKRKPAKEEDKKMLSMKDFMPGKKYQACIPA